MARLAQTEGLTDVQQEILKAVHEFVEKEIIPIAKSSSTPTSTRPRSSRA